MPSAASAATSASTWSRIDINGNLEPQGFPSEASELGPVDPRQPPSTLVATAHQRSVSIGAPGPAMPSHQPGVGCPGPAGPVMCESPVSACRTTTTLSRVGDSSPQRCTAMLTSSITAPLSSVSEPMSTTPTSPSAGSVCVGTSEIVTCGSSERRHGVRIAAPAAGTPPYLRAAAKPSSRSARMSSMPSMPTASRTKPGLTPADSCSAALSWAWVVDAGWITSERTSPMLATWLCSFSALTNALPASHSAGQLEGQHRAGSLGRQLLCPLVPRRAGQARRS